MVPLGLLSDESPLVEAWLELESREARLDNFDLVTIHLEGRCHYRFILYWVEGACGITKFPSHFRHFQPFLQDPNLERMESLALPRAPATPLLWDLTDGGIR